MESNIRAPVLLNLLNSLRKRDKMLGKPCILCLLPNLFNEFNNTFLCTHIRSFITWILSFFYHFFEKFLFLNRGSYMSDHVLLNLLNQLGKRDKI